MMIAKELIYPVRWKQSEVFCWNIFREYVSQPLGYGSHRGRRWVGWVHEGTDTADWDNSTIDYFAVIKFVPYDPINHSDFES